MDFFSSSLRGQSIRAHTLAAAALFIGALVLMGIASKPFITRVAAQGVIGSFQNGIATAPSVFGQADNLAGLYFGTKKVGVAGHLLSAIGSGAAPTLGTCGTGAVTANSTDNAGEVTATGATSCAVVFGAAFTSQPFCVATDNTTAAGLKLAYTAATGFTVTGLTSSDAFTYICLGQTGG